MQNGFYKTKYGQRRKENNQKNYKKRTFTKVVKGIVKLLLIYCSEQWIIFANQRAKYEIIKN